MKYGSQIFVLIFSFVISLLPAWSQSQKKPPMTVESLSEEFFALVMSPSSLTLSVTNEDSLDKAIKKLNSNSDKIALIAKNLKTLDIPKQGRRKIIDEKFTKKELAMRDGVGRKFKEHLDAMPQDLKGKWGVAMRKFYEALDKSTFEAYFAEKPPKANKSVERNR